MRAPVVDVRSLLDFLWCLPAADRPSPETAAALEAALSKRPYELDGVPVAPLIDLLMHARSIGTDAVFSVRCGSTGGQGRQPWHLLLRAYGFHTRRSFFNLRRCPEHGPKFYSGGGRLCSCGCLCREVGCRKVTTTRRGSAVRFSLRKLQLSNNNIRSHERRRARAAAEIGAGAAAEEEEVPEEDLDGESEVLPTFDDWADNPHAAEPPLDDVEAHCRSYAAELVDDSGMRRFLWCRRGGVEVPADGAARRAAVTAAVEAGVSAEAAREWRQLFLDRPDATATEHRVDLEETWRKAGWE